MPIRHHPLTIALHWLSLLLLVGGVAAVLGRDVVEDRALRTLLLELHRNAGVMVLALAAIRLAVRLWKRAHRVEHGLPPLLRRGAQLSHGLLYLGLMAVPLLGWALSSARGQVPLLLGLLPLPALMARDRELAETLEGWHEDLAWVLLTLIALHAAAALWHHHVRRDGVLRAMWPSLTSIPRGTPQP